MARLTLDQINALMPTNESYLQGMGIQQSVGDDGSPVYYKDGNRVSPGQIQEMLGGSDYGLAGRQALDQNGIVDTSFFTGLSPYMQDKYGAGVQSADDYMKYLYGGQGERVGNYWVLPDGMQTSQYTNSPFVNDSPDDKLTQMMPYLIAAGAMAGLGGFLPGTESVFGGAGAAGGAGGLAEAAPVFTGGGSGAGIAGGALGGIPSGLSTAELAALGIGGTGAAAAAGAGAGGFNVADYIANGTLPGGGSVATPALPAGSGIASSLGNVATAGSALSRILDGTATSSDYLSLAGGVGSSLLGVAGSNAQANAYSDVADKYLGLGAPFRSKLEASYAPGFNLATADPAFQGALDQSAQTAARAWSARAGNPADNPGVQGEINKYVLNSSYLPQLNTYRSQLGSFGQLGTNTAGTNDTAAAGQTSGTYNALGYGLGQLTQPQNPFQDAMKGILGGFKLNNSMSF